MSKRLSLCVEYSNEELYTIINSLVDGDISVLRLRVCHVEPDHTDGTLAIADGTDWNPGYGRGLYLYLDGAWKKVA